MERRVTAIVVDVFTEADVTTNGYGSHAIFAQSLGGGGGNGGFSIAGSAHDRTWLR